MYIQRIAIENFGAIQFYNADFTSELNLIDSHYSTEIATAIGVLICNKVLPAIPKQWLQEDTQISARISLEDSIYVVFAKPRLGQLQLSAVDSTGEDATARYQYALSHCLEQDAIETFDGQDKTLPLRLCGYHNRDDHDELSLRTQRLTDTKTFRRHLYHYIHNFRSEPINSKKNFQTAISPQGKFEVFYPEVPGKVYLSETEARLFRYICFLNVAEFWGGFEKIRDLHHEKKPLLIRNFVEFLDESASISGLLVRTQKLHRQIIILTSPLDEKSKKKWKGE